MATLVVKHPKKYRFALTALPYHSKQKGFSRLIGGVIGQGQLLSGGMSELLIANPNSSNWPLTPQSSAPGITQIRSEVSARAGRGSPPNIHLKSKRPWRPDSANYLFFFFFWTRVIA